MSLQALTARAAAGALLVALVAAPVHAQRAHVGPHGGYNLDSDRSGAEQFVRSQGLTWTQTYLGDWRQTPVSPMFGLNGNGSACVLIDPEGKVASGQLRGTALRTALSEALSAE